MNDSKIPRPKPGTTVCWAHNTFAWCAWCETDEERLANWTTDPEKVASVRDYVRMRSEWQ